MIQCSIDMEFALYNHNELEDLKNHEIWRKIRNQARQTLREMGEPIETPDLHYLGLD